MKQKVQEEMKNALRAKDQLKTDTLRMLLSAILNKEIEKRTKASKENSNLTENELETKAKLSDDEFLQTIRFEAKKRKEAIEAYEKGGRPELAQKETIELKILQAYLPEQLSEGELKKLAEIAIKKIGALGPQDMGKVMSEIMAQAKGRVDGGVVGALVKKLLEK